MKAIIAPLNEYFYNYEKYDGLNSLEKFVKKHPRFFNWLEKIQKRDWVQNLFQSKAFKLFLFPLISILFISMVIRVFIIVMPKIVSNIGKRGYFKLINQELNKATDKIVDADIDIKEELTVFLRSGYKLLIYYNPNSLPKEEKNLKSFYEKLEGLKKDGDGRPAPRRRPAMRRSADQPGIVARLVRRDCPSSTKGRSLADASDGERRSTA